MYKQELIDYCNAIKENKNQIINCIDVNRIIKKNRTTRRTAESHSTSVCG